MTVTELTEMIKGSLIFYLGDAVYASWDGFHVWLSTSNGLEITNEVALDPEVLKNLMLYLEGLKVDRN